MKKIRDGIFDYLDWILKKTGKKPTENTSSPYMLNRWLSMTDPVVCQIVNSTTNRWILKPGVASDLGTLSSFYHRIIPKFTKRYSYLTKPKETPNKDKDLHEMAILMECSAREVELYEKTIAKIESKSK